MSVQSCYKQRPIVLTAMAVFPAIRGRARLERGCGIFEVLVMEGNYDLDKKQR